MKAIVLTGIQLIFLSKQLSNSYNIGNPISENDDYRVEVLMELGQLDKIDKDLIVQEDRDEAAELRAERLAEEAATVIIIKRRRIRKKREVLIIYLFRKKQKKKQRRREKKRKKWQPKRLQNRPRTPKKNILSLSSFFCSCFFVHFIFLILGRDEENDEEQDEDNDEENEDDGEED